MGNEFYRNYLFTMMDSFAQKSIGRSPSLVFFDFDGTLIAHDSLLFFAVHSLGICRTLWCGLMASPWILMWKLGLVTNSRAKERLFSLFFKGMTCARFAACCASFEDEIEKMVRPAVVSRLRQHIACGDEVYIVSASISDWILPWAEKNGLDNSHVISTGVAARSGSLTGCFCTPNCHGLEKVNRIKSALGDIEGREIWAYGDSRGDIPMLALADHPFMIKGDEIVDMTVALLKIPNRSAKL